VAAKASQTSKNRTSHHCRFERLGLLERPAEPGALGIAKRFFDLPSIGGRKLFLGVDAHHPHVA
jgi:hypothetical protein